MAVVSGLLQVLGVFWRRSTASETAGDAPPRGDLAPCGGNRAGYASDQPCAGWEHVAFMVSGYPARLIPKPILPELSGCARPGVAWRSEKKQRISVFSS
jgi:hypothetical protein